MQKYIIFKLLAGLFLAFLSVGYFLAYLPLYLIFIWIFCCIAILSWASFDMRLQFFTQSIYKGVHKKSEIALTFDDGPTPFTLQILNILNQYQVKATFFCIGNQLIKYPEIAKQIVAQGHIIGNHTYSHTQKMGFLPFKAVLNEVQDNQQTIKQIAGVNTKWFRPPFGVTNPAIARAIQQANMKCIGWNIRSLDTISKTPQEIFSRIKRKLKPGGIVLMHDTSQKSVIALEQLLVELQKQQITVVPLNELIEKEAYFDEKNNYSI